MTELVEGGPVFPLIVLFGLNAVDELDRTAFGILLPEIRAYFEHERWFGLDPASVVFFRQAMVPALDAQGRILMAAPDAPPAAPG